jgi:hypothetical protein
MPDRISRLLRFLAEGRLTRSSTQQSHALRAKEKMPLLVALAPETRVERQGVLLCEPYRCPRIVMPDWLAYLTVWMDETATTGEWTAMVRRYAGLATHWHKLDASGWGRLQLALSAEILEDLLEYTGSATLVELATQHISMVDRILWGDRTIGAEARELQTKINLAFKRCGADAVSSADFSADQHMALALHWSCSWCTCPSCGPGNPNLAAMASSCIAGAQKLGVGIGKGSDDLIATLLATIEAVVTKGERR